MRRIVYFIISILLIGTMFFKSNYVFSENNIKDFTSEIGCGLLNNQCCEGQKKIKVDIPRIPVPVLGWVIDKLVIPIEGILNGALSPIFTKVSELVIEGIFGVNIDSDTYKCVEGEPFKEGSNCRCIAKNTANLSVLCLNIKDQSEKNTCLACISQENCYWSGLGSIYTDLPSFINKNLFGIFLSFAGVLTLLCIIYSAFILQTSSGNPERIKKAKQNLTSCIVGLLVIIFSIFILRVIGGDIIKIPGIELVN